MERQYEHTYTITYGEVDPRGLARPAAISDILQDIATNHAEMLGLAEPGSHVVWAMTRMRTVLYRPVFAKETLLIRTFCCGLKGPSWLRDFVLKTLDGKTIGQASTYWVLLDIDSGSILRPSYFPEPNQYILPDCQPAVPPQKFHLQHPITCRKHLTSYSDLDLNQHMNNAKIVDLLCDALELHRQKGKFIADLQVFYKTQCRYGDEIILWIENLDSETILLRGSMEEEIKFEACAHLAPY